MLANKNIKEQRTARTARLRSKIEAISQQSQHFNQLYFQFPEPPTTPNSSKLNTTSFKLSHDKSNTTETQDSRRNIIKEKIKFRIKQQLWNLLKKTKDRGEVVQFQNQSNQGQQVAAQDQVTTKTSVSFVKGRSFARFDRDGYHSKKNWSVGGSTCRNWDSERSKTEREATWHERRFTKSRVWGSVKMKESDKAVILKKESIVSKNSFSLHKLELMEIEPWKSPDDSEHQLPA